jgi:hypothetical protein
MGGHAQILGSVYLSNAKTGLAKDYLLENTVTKTQIVMHSYIAQFQAHGLSPALAKN